MDYDYQKGIFWNIWISYILNISYAGEKYMEYDYQTYYHKILFMNILPSGKLT